RVDVALCERAVGDSVCRQSLKVLECFEYPFTREPVERPEQEAIKFASGCSVKHLLKLRSVAALAAGVVNVLAGYRPALLVAELPQLLKLVLSVLSAVLGGNPSVKCNAQLLFVCHALTLRPARLNVKNNLHINGCFCAHISTTDNCLCFVSCWSTNSWGFCAGDGYLPSQRNAGWVSPRFK